MIVDLSIEDDGSVTVFAGDGLIAAVDVDDAEADGAEGYEIGLESALLIWAAVKGRTAKKKA